MLKVLHIIQGCGGGVAALIGNLIRSADKTAVTQDVMSFSYENGEIFVDVVHQNGGRTILLPRPRKEGYRAFRAKMLEAIREGQYDVVHCHSDGWRTVLYRNIARRAGIRLFCLHAHRAANDPGKLKNSKAFIRINQAISRRNADVKFACGQEAAKFIYGDVEDFVVIPNGISLNRCEAALQTNPDKKRAEFGIEEGQKVILQVGRLVTQKNHEFTVEIARALKERGVAYQLLIAGTGALEQSIRDKLTSEDLQDHVKLLGRRNDVYELMAMADVMILPSLYEGLPTVAVEAQAMGLYSVIADTVTAECDMGLGLVNRIPINQGAACWAEAIAAAPVGRLPESTQIWQVLQENAYTAEASVQRYVSTLRNQIGEE